MNREQTALVTGASKGIGLEVARQLVERGWYVCLTARNLKADKKTALTLRSSIHVVELDVTKQPSIERAVKEVSAAMDHLDVLVNNAGILEDGDDSVPTVDADLLRRTLETNTLGPLMVTQAFLPLLRKSRGARIVNVSSTGGQLTGMGHWAPAYSISKAALNAVTGQFAAALAPEKIAVNSVCPGWVRTDMGGCNAPRSVTQGADSIVWLATEAPHELTGKFIQDRKVIDW
ncbi:MAG: short-chain dehydrogenase [Nitrospira sp. SG-bin1]|nr:MAG: short-chain dehydrogenase [Nitrospira sp. SG-bin1]